MKTPLVGQSPDYSVVLKPPTSQTAGHGDTVLIGGGASALPTQTDVRAAARTTEPVGVLASLDATTAERVKQAMGKSTVDATHCAAQVPWIEHVRPEAAIMYVSADGVESLNKGCTYFSNVPGMGWGVTKTADTFFGNPHAELMFSLLDDHLPPVPGGTDRVVPKTTLVWLDQPATARLKDGTPATPMAAGLYSFQSKVEGASEYRDQSLPAGSKYHPDYVRMGYLDALTYNLDRSVGNWLVDAVNKPWAIDNGAALNDTYMDLDEDYGVLAQDQGVIAPQHTAAFMADSHAYSIAAQAALTDPVLESIVAQARQVPEFANLKFDHILSQLKSNRDRIPDLTTPKIVRRGMQQTVPTGD